MKYLPHLLSFLAFFLVIAKIRYDEAEKADDRGQSDEEVVRVEKDADGLAPLTIVSYDLPDSLSFAGERVPMEIPDVRERFDKELHINTYWHNNTIFLIKRAHRWLPRISRILKDNGIPDDFKYMPLIESALLNDISPADAVGFWQIRKASGKELGLEISHDVDERYDPIMSTEAACAYLKKAYSKFGNWTLVAASYDRGMSGLQRALDNQSVKSYYDLYLNEETSRYMFRVLACKEILEHPHRYGFFISPSHLYNEEPVRYVEVKDDIPDLVVFARQQGINYKLLKRHNPWLQNDRLRVRRGKTYRIAIPENTE